MKLSNCILDVLNGELIVTWTWSGDFPRAGTVLLGTNLYEGPVAQRLLGLKFLDGEPIAQYVFWWKRATQGDFPINYELDEAGGACIVRYPSIAAGGMPIPFRWQAVLNVDGRDVDQVNSSDRVDCRWK